MDVLFLKNLLTLVNRTDNLPKILSDIGLVGLGPVRWLEVSVLKTLEGAYFFACSYALQYLSPNFNQISFTSKRLNLFIIAYLCARKRTIL